MKITSHQQLDELERKIISAVKQVWCNQGMVSGIRIDLLTGDVTGVGSIESYSRMFCAADRRAVANGSAT